MNGEIIKTVWCAVMKWTASNSSGSESSGLLRGDDLYVCKLYIPDTPLQLEDKLGNPKQGFNKAHQ